MSSIIQIIEIRGLFAPNDVDHPLGMTIRNVRYVDPFHLAVVYVIIHMRGNIRLEVSQTNFRPSSRKGEAYSISRDRELNQKYSVRSLVCREKGSGVFGLRSAIEELTFIAAT